MQRYSIKIAGQSGQGIETVGKLLTKALKRTGFYIFGYREYPSLIKGGNASYQIDFSTLPIYASTRSVDIVIVLNKQSVKWHLEEIKEGGIVLHDTERVRLSEEDKKLLLLKKVKFVYVPALEIAIKVGGSFKMTNTAILGVLWKILHLPLNELAMCVMEAFVEKKGIGELNVNVLREGYAFEVKEFKSYGFLLHHLSAKNLEFTDFTKEELYKYFPNDLYTKTDKSNISKPILTGNEAVSLGAISAGVKAYYSYPMTPTSSILTYLSEKSKETGMLVKQVEDEITAAGITIGSMLNGVRAFSATSGGGFDLMTEHLSLTGIAEIPFVILIGQRPGPATGLPTWTTQGDLNLAIYSGHGEFPRIVIAFSNPEDAYYKTQMAYNLAERYQLPVILLTDKLIAESIYLTNVLEEKKIKQERYILDTSKLTEEEIQNLKRYEITPSGISNRWLPLSVKKGYVINSDEHDEEGNVSEDADNAVKMQLKRHLKLESVIKELPEPEVYRNFEGEGYGDICLLGWGSTLSVVKDSLEPLKEKGLKISYIHYEYIFPLKTDEIFKAKNSGVKIVAIEGNLNSQLAKLIRGESGIAIEESILKYDGRPFFVEELSEKILGKLK